MDLAGNGIVVTLAHGFVIDGVTQGALCFDLKFKEPLNDLLDKRIRSLGGTTVNVKCHLGEPTKVEVAEPEKLVPSAKALVNRFETYVDKQVAQSDMLGKIQVLNSPSPDAESSDPLQISMPIDAAEVGTDSQTLILMSVDLAEFRRRTTHFALAAVICFLLPLAFVWYMWQTVARHKREYLYAFERVAGVMNLSPTAYLRLSANDQIQEYNPTFLTLLGYTADDVRGKTFESFCDDQGSAQTYEGVQDKRKNVKPVRPYELKLLKKDGTTVKLWVVSAAVPAEIPGALPETFGILLDDVQYQQQKKLANSTRIPGSDH